MSHVLKEVIKNISIDCAVFGFEQSVFEILLIKRARNPNKGRWALPGGFIKKEELVEDAAKRILKVTTGVSDIYLPQTPLGSFQKTVNLAKRTAVTEQPFNQRSLGSA